MPFFNSASVLLEFLMNWALIVVYVAYIYIYIYSKYTQERRTTISDKLLRISTFQITSNNITFYKFYNITSYFYRNILLSVPSKYQMQLKTSSENVWNNYLIIL